MENIVEALKLFYGVTVFAIALSVFFQMTALAKDTSDIVFAAIDETTFINYDADTSDGGNRKVTFQEIIPTIYRYAREAYGVTIIDNGKIIARFDLDTESQVSSCFWTDLEYNAATQPGGQITTVQRNSNKIKYEMTKYLNNNIFKPVGLSEITLGDESTKETNSSHPELDVIIKRIYWTGTPTKPVYTGWLKSNTYKDNYITQRINCDIYGKNSSVADDSGITYFSLMNEGVNEKVDPWMAHKAVCEGEGLLREYGSANLNSPITFTEYIVQIDRNEYIADEDGNNTGLLVFGTLRNTKKREIVYVKE